jgi:hypothetical protein
MRPDRFPDAREKCFLSFTIPVLFEPLSVPRGFSVDRSKEVGERLAVVDITIVP